MSIGSDGAMAISEIFVGYFNSKRKVPEAYSRADDCTRSLNGLRDDVWRRYGKTRIV